MSHLEYLASCKKRKWGERVFRFNTFCENGYPVDLDGNFSQNVKRLLELGHFEGVIWDGLMPSWSFQLEVNRHPPFHVFLLVVEEPVELSMEQHCRHCRYVGWGHHMICNKKYHFVLPSSFESIGSHILGYNNGYDGSPAISSSSSMGKFNFVELVQGEGGGGHHLMHGVFHSNGFGHLLCVNGMEAGSRLSGCQIMEFWDRLSLGLRSRRVSLMDTSQKKSMELRLLHGIAYGEPWFSHWGYKFGRGSFGVTQPIYQKAIETIRGIPLSLILRFLGTTNNDLPIILSRYQTLSGHVLATFGDLLRFMMELKPRLPDENRICASDVGVIWEPNCRWSPKRVEMAIRVIVEALRGSRPRWISRQEVRDAARVYIGDTGLLDYVLKSLGNHIVGSYLVRRSLNPVTKVLEYCLEDVSNVLPDQVQVGNNNPRAKGMTKYKKMTRTQLTKDVYFLYKYILQDQNPISFNIGILNSIPAATNVILDSKLLVKEYHDLQLPEPDTLTQGKSSIKLYCSIVLTGAHAKKLQPFERITLKNNSTFRDLKIEVSRTFRDLYWGLRGFTIDSIVDLENARDTDLVFRVVEVGRKLVFQGRINNINFFDRGGLSMVNNNNNDNNCSIYEIGMDDKVVGCNCGATEDDGERLVACDICDIWQHTRCVGIPNDQEIPHIFLCNRCEHEISVLPSLP